MIFPGLLHISLVNAMIKGDVIVGAQNVGEHQPGAHTGEIAADHIKDYGINWVLIGHSERRTLFGETNEVISHKVR